MTKVAVIGAGFVGRSWAIAFSRARFEVALFDVNQDALSIAIASIANSLGELESFDLLGGSSPESVLQRISCHDRLEKAVDGVVHIQENAPEKVELKQALFSEFERYASKDAVLASSTSAILPSVISGHLRTRERCLVAHPLNPPYLIPATEIVPSKWTSKKSVEATVDLMRQAGQSPIVMQGELNGFVMNRLQGALLEEAFRLVDGGHVSPEDIDVSIREGLALRWSFMGPFETIDLNAPGGVRDYVSRYHGNFERMYHDHNDRVDWEGPVLEVIENDRRSRVPKNKLPERQNWRDRQLMALASHKRQAGRDVS